MEVWTAHGSRGGQLPIAGFDLDGTLVEYRRGAAGAPRWRAGAHELLRSYVEGSSAGAPWRVLIYTNCGSPRRVAALAELAREWGDVDWIASLRHDRGRKPQTGAWEAYLDRLRAMCACPTAAQLAASFYCGDAAGRPGDFAATDRWFAENARLTYYTPEQLLLKDPPPAPLAAVHRQYHDLVLGGLRPDGWEEAAQELASGGPRLVVLTGAPASGKSTFAALLTAKGFVLATRDPVPGRPRRHTAARCLKEAKALLLSGQRVVVDNTHGPAAARDAVLRLCSDAAVVWLATPPWLCEHLNGLREKAVPVVALSTFWKRFEEPKPEPERNVVTLGWQEEPGAPALGKLSEVRLRTLAAAGPNWYRP